MALYTLAYQDFKNNTESLLYGAFAQTFTISHNARIVKVKATLYKENKTGYSGTITMQILKTTQNYYPSTDPDDILYSQEYDISLLYGFPSDTEFDLTDYVEVQKNTTYAVAFWWDGRYGEGGSDDRLILWDYKDYGGSSSQFRYIYDTEEERWEPDPDGGVYRYWIYGHRKPEITACDPQNGHSGIYEKLRVIAAYFTYASNHVFYIGSSSYNGTYPSSNYDYCVLSNYLSVGNHSWYVRYSSIDDEDWTLTSDTFSFNIIEVPSLPGRQLLAGDISSDKTTATEISTYDAYATLFTAISGELSHIRLSLARNSSFVSLSNDWFTVEVRTVNESDMTPTNVILATGKFSTYPMALRPTIGAFDSSIVLADLEAELDNIVELENGKTYALVYYGDAVPIYLGLISETAPWDDYGRYYYNGENWILYDDHPIINATNPKWLSLFGMNVDAEISIVRLLIGKDGELPTCNMLVEIYEYQGGIPVGSALASVVIDTEELPDVSSDYYSFLLGESITLEQGKYYALVLSLVNPQSNDVLYWDGFFYASIASEMLSYNSYSNKWSHYIYSAIWAGLMGQATFVPASPEPIYPQNNQVDVEDWPLILEWECDKDPDEYRVYFRQTPFGGGELDDGINSHLIGVLTRNGSEPVPTYLVLPDYIENIFTKWPQANTQFSWKVVAIWHFEDDDAVSEELPIPYSNQWNFTTPAYGTGTGIYYLNLPINPTPSNESTSVNTRTENATWENGGGALTYDVYFGTRDYYLEHDGSLQKVASSVPDASKVLSLRSQSLEYGTTYLWRVNPKNTVFEREGTLWEFETDIVGSGTGVPFPDGYYAKFIKRLIIAADDTIWYEEE